MNRIDFLVIGAASVMAACSAAPAGPLTLRNERLSLTLGQPEKGAVRSLADLATGSEFIAPDGAARLFSLAFSRP